MIEATEARFTSQLAPAWYGSFSEVIRLSSPAYVNAPEVPVPTC